MYAPLTKTKTLTSMVFLIIQNHILLPIYTTTLYLVYNEVIIFSKTIAIFYSQNLIGIGRGSSMSPSDRE